jgi:hypothetical protein
VVAAVLAQRRNEKRLHAFESEFVEVVVWHLGATRRQNGTRHGGQGTQAGQPEAHVLQA